jgi:hypothetical protein
VTLATVAGMCPAQLFGIGHGHLCCDDGARRLDMNISVALAENICYIFHFALVTN